MKQINTETKYILLSKQETATYQYSYSKVRRLTNKIPNQNGIYPL